MATTTVYVRGDDDGRFGRQVLELTFDLVAPADDVIWHAMRPDDGLLDMVLQIPWMRQDAAAQAWEAYSRLLSLRHVQVDALVRSPRSERWWYLSPHARIRMGEMAATIGDVLATVADPDTDYPSKGRRVACRDTLAVVYEDRGLQPHPTVVTVLWNGHESRAARPPLLEPSMR